MDTIEFYIHIHETEMHSFVYLIAGAALMNIVGVYKEIQDQHMNIVRSLFNLEIYSAKFWSAFN